MSPAKFQLVLVHLLLPESLLPHWVSQNLILYPLTIFRYSNPPETHAAHFAVLGIASASAAPCHQKILFSNFNLIVESYRIIE